MSADPRQAGGRGHAGGQRLEHRAQLRVDDGSQAAPEFGAGGRAQRGWGAAAFARDHVALPDRDARDGGVGRRSGSPAPRSRGVMCCIIGAWAPFTTRLSVPSRFSPAGKRSDSGDDTPAQRSPTISGQRLTIADWTKPNLRNATPPIAGNSSSHRAGAIRAGWLRVAEGGRVCSRALPCHSDSVSATPISTADLLSRWYDRHRRDPAVAGKAGRGGGPLSRVAVRGDAAADHGGDGAAAVRGVDCAVAGPCFAGGGGRGGGDGSLGWAGLLCPCAQPDASGADDRDGAWRGVARARGSVAGVARIRCLHRSGGGGDRIRPARRGGRRQCRARGGAAARDRDALARRKVVNPGGGRTRSRPTYGRAISRKA